MGFENILPITIEITNLSKNHIYLKTFNNRDISLAGNTSYFILLTDYYEIDKIKLLENNGILSSSLTFSYKDVVENINQIPYKDLQCYIFYTNLTKEQILTLLLLKEMI